MGAYDVAFLSALPNMIVAAPMDEHELQDLLHTAIAQREHPFAIRYPRASVSDGVDLARKDFSLLPIGRWETLREGSDVCILAVGTMVKPALAAAKDLAGAGIDAHVVNCRYLKPMDVDLLVEAGRRFGRILTVEESALWSGFGANVGRILADHGVYPEIRSLGMPDRVIDHAARKIQLEECGLTPAAIAEAARALVDAPVRP
jgi:1-deoxy-D-xylulose-5-phosphate synthase